LSLELSFGCSVQERAGISLLQWASWLREAVPHGITTREGGVSRGAYASLNLGDNVGDVPGAVIANRAKLGAALGDMRRPRVFPRQVHGTDVHVVKDLPRPGDPPPEADALITNRMDVFIGVTVADCVPVLFYDPIRRAVGAAHAGWRGLEAGVLRNTVEAMQREYGIVAATLQAAIGPHIGVCCYEVSEDVAGRFEGILKAVRHDKEGRLYVDLGRVARAQLSEAGLNPDYVSTSAPCTSCFVDAYYSHRAEGTTGRFAAIVGLAEMVDE
jgi:YfiH family protein